MTAASPTKGATPERPTRTIGSLISSLELDTRLLGILGIATPEVM